MSDPQFTILLPVHRPPALLPHAIASILAQKRQDFELFIICDGAPLETVACAERFAQRDHRIRVFAHPKGARNGEAYRHLALQQARGGYVCQIGDDDLWLPNHLVEMARLLVDVDFGNLPQIEVGTDGALNLVPGDLADAATRQRMQDRPYNFFGPTVCGYRLNAYRALPEGWTPAPPEAPNDLFMWRKFLAQDGLRFGTRSAISSLKFTAYWRADWPIERRAAEIAAWAERLSRPEGQYEITQAALHQANRTLYDVYQQLDRLRRRLTERTRQLDKWRSRERAMKATLSWRFTRPFRRLGRLLRRS